MFRKLKKFIKTVWYYKDLLWEDEDWDFEFLIDLERAKLVRMQKYFEGSNIAEGDEKVAKQIQMAINLLDIAMEREVPYNEVEQRFEDEEYKKKLAATNVRNANRFMNDYELKTYKKWAQVDNPDSFSNTLYEQTRARKAWHLYSMFRERYTQNWWN